MPIDVKSTLFNGITGRNDSIMGTTTTSKRYVMQPSPGYAYSSLKSSGNVILSDADCKQAVYCGQVIESTADSKPFCKFRVGKQYRYQLAQYCELTPIRDFREADIVDGQFPRIYCDRSELLDAPLWHHLRGLSQSASGYGAKLVNSCKICFEGRFYRVYVTCYSNSSSSWFKVRGRTIYVS